MVLRLRDINYCRPVQILTFSEMSINFETIILKTAKHHPAATMVFGMYLLINGICKKIKFFEFQPMQFNFTIENRIG